MFEIVSSTIKGSKEQFAHYGESLIDLAVDNETWENIPFVDHAVKLLTIKDVYKKNKLKRNYQSFIEAIQIMNQSEIDKYLDILRENGSLKEEVTETIFDVITESEKPLKPKIIGNLTVALSKQNITLEEYYTLSLIVQSASIPALKSLKTFMESSEFKGHMNGLKSRVPEEPLLISLGVANRFGTGLRLDENGKKLVEFGMNLTFNS